MSRSYAFACASLLLTGGLAACGGGDDKEPVTIGMSVSLSGPDAEFGATMLSVANAAVAKINEAGGADGHEIILVSVDDETTAEGAAEAVRILTEEEGAVAIVGPFNSGPVGATLDKIEEHSTPLVSPSSTSPTLADPLIDGGFLFRTAPNDNFQVLAMGHYLEDLADTTVGEILIVHEDGDYGDGLANALEGDWVDTRDHALTADAMEYTPDPGFDQTAADSLWDSIVAANPPAIVMIGLGTDINVLLRTWLTSGQLPDVQWFFSDSAKATAIFGDSTDDTTFLPLAAEGLRGTAATSPKTSIAFTTFVESVDEVEGIDVSDQAYTQNTWDAVYLIAAALVQQSADGETFGGSDLRDALTTVSKGGQTYHAGQWRDLVSSVRSGSDVDYDGASGPVDFDDAGEVLAPYEVWEITTDSATPTPDDWTFEQVEYIETDELHD